MTAKFTIVLASIPDQENVVAEIWWGDSMFAELHRGQRGEVMIEIFTASSRDTWQFEYTEMLNVIDEAKRKLY
ncbi:hypothetical protein [Oharaeibacter diazotrophicus]|uniref:hypothetical protein n=1 Tax=Oharaeibacter diazotrophicus TaxID=1920512 RepID=UPI000F83848D|nr:hypothetical protein [Oharaeibacter diazotrophicus]GLS78177.1 hypothetical protein GCM10007904_35140 [Oharaeibacter diazotrophicus]